MRSDATHPAGAHEPDDDPGVLLVDDDGDLRSALAQALTFVGIRSVEAPDGADALEMMRAGTLPCVVVVDADMPRLSGPDLVAAMRGDPALHPIPVITMTAGAKPPAFEALPFLAKPFDVRALLGVLFEACRACRRCDAGARPAGSLEAARRAAGGAPRTSRDASTAS